MRLRSNDGTPNSRADDARRRRGQRSQARVSTAATRATKSTRPKPVTVRGNTFGTPIHRQAGTKRARRQFYIAMDQVGSELRLPAISLVNPGWRLASGLLVILSLMGIFTFWSSPYFQISTINVQGLQRLDPTALSGLLNLNNLSIIEVDEKMALGTLSQAYPELINIEVKVEMPNIVTIAAAERQPVLAWLKGDQVSWIDAEGVIFPARGEAGPLITIESEDDPPLAPRPIEEALTPTPPGPQAEGEKQEAKKGLFAPAVEEITTEPVKKTTPDKVDPVLLSVAQQLNQKLQPGTTLVYTQVNGLGWYDPQGYQVFFGNDLSNYEEKYALYQALAGHLAEQGLQPVLLSVENLNAPFYRLEQ